jgi:integrase
MSVYKRKGSPFYHYDFQLDGRQFRGSTQVKSKAEARQVEVRIKVQRREELKLIRDAGDTPFKIDQAFERYWIEAGQFPSNASDLYTYMAQLHSWFASQGVTQLTEITDSVIAKMVTWRRAHYRWGKVQYGLIKPAQVNRSTIHVIRRVMVRAREIWKMPLTNMPKWGNHLLKEPEERVRILAPEEHTALHASLNPDYEQLRLFALASGLRLKESLLCWSNIDWTTKNLAVPGKKGKMARRPITREMEAILRGRQGHHDEFIFTKVIKRPRPGQVKGDRSPITEEGLNSHWVVAKKRAKVKDFRWHDNRHTFATELLRSSGNLKMVQLALGHSKIETTTKYAHVLDDELREAMEVASVKTRERLPSLSPLTGGK